MMTREQLFEHLMEHDPDFRKEVVSAATVAGMELYQAALSMLDKDEKTDAVATATSQIVNAAEADKMRKGPSGRSSPKGKSAKKGSSSARAKAARAREKGKTTEMRAKQRENNEKIRNALVKILTAHGPMTLAEIKAKMHPKTAALAGDGQCFHNQMYALKTAKQIRWTRGAKRPNVKWEIVP